MNINKNHPMYCCYFSKKFHDHINSYVIVLKINFKALRRQDSSDYFAINMQKFLKK